MGWQSADTWLKFVIMLFLVCFISGGILPLWPGRREKRVYLSLGLAGLGSLGAFVAGIYALARPDPQGFEVFALSQPLVQGFPHLTVKFFADHLSGFFLIITGGLSFAVMLHMVDWLRDVQERHSITAVFNLFVLFILLTILANTTYLFLVALEGITLTFSYLALFKHNEYVRKTQVDRAALEASQTAFKTYLIFEHTGVMLIALALMILSVQVPDFHNIGNTCASFLGQRPTYLGFDFDAFRCVVQHNGLPNRMTMNLVFLLALAGFGIKAGVFPAHVWVTLVHPYSPTSIDAMMSGIVLKVAGIYGMYRVFFEFLGPGDWWWGLVVLLLAGATALVGVFYALLQKDLKAALACHSVENIGIVLFGIGLAMIYHWADASALLSVKSAISPGFQPVAVLALVASLYHLLNHSVFKSLLFFSTGAFENRTGSTSLDRLGGLMNRYPWTSIAFLVGAVSIAGFPPFNGFISEWLTLQALFSGMGIFYPGMQPRIYLLVGIIGALICLALAFGLTAMAFVKLTGEALLGAPRDAELARNSKTGDVPWHMRSVLVILAGLCLILGLFSAPFAQGISSMAGGLLGVKDGLVFRADGLNLSIHLEKDQVKKTSQFHEPEEQLPLQQEKEYRARVSIRFLGVLVGILAFPFILNWAILRSKWANRLRLRRGPLWIGGDPFQPGSMQYTGSAFSSLVWLPFEKRQMPAFFLRWMRTEGAPEYLPVSEPLTERRAVLELFSLVYDRSLRLLLTIAQSIGDWIQNGDIRRYLRLIFVLFVLTLVVLIMISAGGGR